MSTTTHRKVKDIQSEIAAVTTAREQAKGRAKGQLTRQLKSLEAELEQARKPRPKGLNSADILAAGKTAKDVNELAKALGVDVNSPDFRRRVNHLSQGTRGLDKKFDVPTPAWQNPALKAVREKLNGGSSSTGNGSGQASGSGSGSGSGQARAAA